MNISLLLVLAAWLLRLDRATAQVAIEAFVQTSVCLEEMNNADIDTSGNLDLPEFFAFAKSYAWSYLPDTDQIPLIIQLAFHEISCYCQNEFFGWALSDDYCCSGENATIWIPEDCEDELELIYLVAACDATKDAADNYGKPSVVPTRSPTISSTNTPTYFPTFSPAQGPTVIQAPPFTVAPATRAPVKSPVFTDAPSSAPTALPIVDVWVSYQIAIVDGNSLLQDSAFRREYPMQLKLATDGILSTITSAPLVLSGDGGILSSEVILASAACPYGFADMGVCLSIITMISTKNINVKLLQNETEARIRDGTLQMYLDDANWESVNSNPIQVLQPVIQQPNPSSSSDTGIIVGSVVALSLVCATILGSTWLIVKRRRAQSQVVLEAVPVPEEAPDIHSVDLAEGEVLEFDRTPDDLPEFKDQVRPEPRDTITENEMAEANFDIPKIEDLKKKEI